MNLNDIQHLFTYTEWANGLTLDAAEKLSSDQLLRDVQISHGSILGTLAHMAGGEWIWLERWKGNSPGGQDIWAPWTAKGCGGLPQLRARWREISDDRRAYLSRITDGDLPRDLTFKRLNGEQYALPLGQQMQHVVNHATLHRGQVVGMIRQLGIVPPATDILFYLFEKKK